MRRGSLIPVWLIPVCLILGVIGGRHVVRAQAGKPTEYEVEAAYLANFARFVEWPVKGGVAADPFSICVLGQDPFGALLDNALKGETIGNSRMAAKRIAGPEEAAGCRIVFISPAKASQLAAILKALGTNVLTVSDMPDFSRRGGMIQFVLQDNRVRFEINLAAAQRAGLTLSSELLRVAVAVRRGP